jgi:S-adenosylmethionine hydrolase
LTGTSLGAPATQVDPVANPGPQNEKQSQVRQIIGAAEKHYLRGQSAYASGQYELARREFWRREQSSTFHGRDVFGPVAGHLANGVPLERLGDPVALERPFEIALADGDVGVVLHVDTYGNLITNLTCDRSVLIKSVRVPRQPYFAAAQPGELLALIGSSGLLEIAVRDGDASKQLRLKVGDEVELK